MIVVGVAGGLAATVFGLIDLERVPDGTRAKAVGIVHGVCAGGLMILFAVSWLLRLGAPEGPGTVPIILSLLGVGLAGLTGWFVGELIARLGVGVSMGALERPQLALRASGRRGFDRRAEKGVRHLSLSDSSDEGAYDF